MREVMKSLLASAVVSATLVALLATACYLYPLPPKYSPPSVKAEDNVIEREVIAPYVEIERGGHVGSGVCVAPRLVLTAAHVVQPGAEGVTMSRKSGRGKVSTWTGRVVYYAPIADLALIRTEDDIGPAARFDADIVLRRGEPCYYVGTPRGTHGSLERSIINHDFAKVRGRGFTLVNGNGWYGSSGGPLYVERRGHWYLVGIASEIVREDMRTPLAFVPLDDIASPLGCYTR